MPDQSVMVDFASVLNGYHLDETRMFAIGSMPEKALQASRFALEMHDTIIEKAKPGVTLGALFDYSVRLAESRAMQDPTWDFPGTKSPLSATASGWKSWSLLLSPETELTAWSPGWFLPWNPSSFMKTSFAPASKVFFWSPKPVRI